LIFFCVGAKPLLFVVVDIGEGQQQRHHSSKAPISNPLPIYHCLTFLHGKCHLESIYELILEAIPN
jgi:hypothetical protein